MKQHTNELQTAKLIELGFVPKPKIKEVRTVHSEVVVDHDCNFTIGELLSFLPKSIKVNDLSFTLCIHSSTHYWIVEYADISFGTQARLYMKELIDALFTEIVALKAEGVI